jgi:hypothetical protein
MEKVMTQISNKISLVTGSIFEPAQFSLDGIIVWLPCGMTSLRCDWLDFAAKLEGHIHRPGGNPSEIVEIPHAIRTRDTLNKAHQFSFYSISPPVDGVHFLHFDLNLGHRIEDIEEIPFMVEKSLEALTKLGARSIGMNAIRTHSHARASEQALIQAVSEWVAQNDDMVSTVYLIDKRGGFQKKT